MGETPIRPELPPSGTGCLECEATGGWWFHLRRCAHCGQVSCCDSSPSQHALHHAVEQDHPMVRSFEPDEDWFWSYEAESYYQGPQLAPPDAHPRDQTAPGPADRVPEDWQEHLH